MGARARIVRTAVEGPPSGAEVDAADFVMVGDVVLKNRFGPTGRVVGGSNGVLPALDGLATGTSYAGGVWTDGVTLTSAHLDANHGLQQPRTGSKFLGG